VNIFINSNKRY